MLAAARLIEAAAFAVAGRRCLDQGDGPLLTEVKEQAVGIGDRALADASLHAPRDLASLDVDAQQGVAVGAVEVIANDTFSADTESPSTFRFAALRRSGALPI